MTLAEFKALSSLHDQRVQMNFSDGQTVIATLHSVVTDLDDSRHVIYRNVEWSSVPLPKDTDEVWHTKGEELISCVTYNDN